MLLVFVFFFFFFFVHFFFPFGHAYRFERSFRFVLLFFFKLDFIFNVNVSKWIELKQPNKIYKREAHHPAWWMMICNIFFSFFLLFPIAPCAKVLCVKHTVINIFVCINGRYVIRITLLYTQYLQYVTGPFPIFLSLFLYLYLYLMYMISNAIHNNRLLLLQNVSFANRFGDESPTILTFIDTFAHIAALK